MEQRFTSIQPAADLPKLQAILQAREPAEGAEGRGWYSIKNVSATETEIFIFDEIGFFGVTASDFVKDLADIRANKITLRINSPGGDVFDGIAIFNALKRHEAEINIFVEGIAASAASFIAMAGDTITMMPHSQMMIHEAHGLVIGPADDMRKMADILDKSSNNIASIYAERAGGTIEEWRARMRDETWFSDQEAVELGLADSIEGEDAENVAARIKARQEPEVEPEPEQEPEPEADTPPLDFMEQFEAIADEAEESQYAVETVN
jgi:ATP-dependent Clp endopeptidase proteolytic subunit ClpP